jgi:hypothetical protein
VSLRMLTSLNHTAAASGNPQRESQAAGVGMSHKPQELA